MVSLSSWANNSPGLQFVENKNQWDASAQFGARFPGGQLFFGAGRFAYYLFDADKVADLHELSHQSFDEATGNARNTEMIDAYWIYADFLNSNKEAKGVGVNKLRPYYNYFIGSDQKEWASGARAYAGVWFENFYPGVGMTLYAKDSDLKYDFVVAAGADPCQIVWRYQGADETVASNGNIYLKTSLGFVIERKPYAYQNIGGIRKEVPVEYVVSGDQISFTFPNGYDECYELVIDPLLIFSTYSGSTADNWGSTATPAENGNLYSSGITNHNNTGFFPATAGAFQTAYGGLFDVAILKYDSAGGDLMYASYLGGTGDETPHSLIMNSSEELIVLGTTGSTNFPTSTSAFDRSFNGGVPTSNTITYGNGSDIFVARINKEGTQLLASTYLGGSLNDGLNASAGPLRTNYGDEQRGDIITDDDGNVYFASVTLSNNFPMVNSLYDTIRGETDAIIVKLNKELSQIAWSTYLGGTSFDTSHTIKFDSNGDIYVAGGTNSADFPVLDATAGTPSYKSTLNGSVDGWIAKIANDGSELVQATFTGTSRYDQIYFLDINQADEVYVYGQTSGPGEFPIFPSNVYRSPNSGQFLQKFSADLSTLMISTIFGAGRGTPDISPTAFLVSECSNIYMTGWGGVLNHSPTGKWNQSSTTGMLKSGNHAYQSTTSGSDFYFIVLSDDATQLLYDTYLGGTQSRTHVDGGTSRFDKTGVVYHAVCSGCSAGNASGQSTSDFPTTAWRMVARKQKHQLQQRSVQVRLVVAESTTSNQYHRSEKSRYHTSVFTRPDCISE